MHVYWGIFPSVMLKLTNFALQILNVVSSVDSGTINNATFLVGVHSLNERIDFNCESQ